MNNQFKFYGLQSHKDRCTYEVAQVYINIRGVLNSNKPYLLAFVHIQINLRSLFHLQMYTYSHYNFSSAVVFWYARKPKHVKYLMPNLLNVSMYVHVYVQILL